MTNAILSQEEDNPIKVIEKIITKGFERDYDTESSERLSVLISGIYYGLINHYHINNKAFDCEDMKAKFKELLSRIIKA